MAKHAGRVGSGLSWVNRVASQSGSFLNGSIRLRVAGQVGLRIKLSCPIFFKQAFFFFEIDAICQLLMSFLTVIRFSLVILFLITTKHLIPKFGATLIPAF